MTAAVDLPVGAGTEGSCAHSPHAADPLSATRAAIVAAVAAARKAHDEARRAFAVLDPILLTITNWPEGEVEEFEVEAHPKKPEMGMRTVPFSGQVYIDREDFNENPPKGYFRLTPGGQVRLRFAYVVTADEIVKDADGKVTVATAKAVLADLAGIPGAFAARGK